MDSEPRGATWHPQTRYADTLRTMIDDSSATVTYRHTPVSFSSGGYLQENYARNFLPHSV